MGDPKKFTENAAPENWFSYAIELTEAANELFKRLGSKLVVTIDTRSETSDLRPLVSRPALLLYGQAVENLIKAILISENPLYLEGGKLSKQIQGHDLNRLSNRIRTYDWTSDERELLNFLSDIVPYSGRYPVPRAADAIKAECYISFEIHSACNALIEKLSLELYRLNFDGISAPNEVKWNKLRLTHLDNKAYFLDWTPNERKTGQRSS
ncbi:MAG: hypothetical protein VX974_19890 [Pseudomonadota bacterium]|nr:hypothetical protein [Pseudomonadota bacterium]